MSLDGWYYGRTLCILIVIHELSAKLTLSFTTEVSLRNYGLRGSNNID